MTTKNIEFKFTGDVKDLETKLTALQQKFREMSSKTSIGERAAGVYGEGSAMGERAQKMQEQYKRSSIDFLEKEHEKRERYAKVYDDRLKRINVEIGEQNKGSEKQLKLIDERDKAQKKLNETMEEAVKIAAEYQKITGTVISGTAGGAPPAQTPTPGGGGAEGGGGGFGSMLRSGWGQALQAYAMAQIVMRASGFVGEILKHTQEVSIREASIAQLKYDVSGRREELEGDYLKNKFFAPERATGLEESRTFASRLGTKLVNLPGGVMAGLRDTLSGDLNQTAAKQYAEQTQLESERESVQAALAKNPELSAAFDYFTSRKGSFLQAQQMSGMGDKGLMDFLGRGTGLFSPEQKLGAMSEIYGAGGSTAQGGRAFEALQLKREFGIQGAGQILGGLSGNIGGGATGSESVARKILSEAFSSGLDSSKFSRETERFLDMSAKFIEQSGARTPEAMMRVAEGMGGPLGTSMADIRAFAGAESSFQNVMGEGAGDYSKSLQLSFARSHEKIGKLSEEQRMQIAGLNPGQIRAGGDYLEGLAKDAGYSNYSEFVKDILGPSGMKSFGATLTEESSGRLSRLGQIQTESGFDIFNKEVFEQKLKESSPEEQEKLNALREEAMGISRKLVPSMQAQGQIPRGVNPNDYFSYLSKFTGFETEDTLSGTLVGRPKSEMPSRGMTTFDFAEQAAAEGEQNKLENAMQNMGRYSQLVGDVATQTENLAKAIESAVTKINQTLGQQQQSGIPLIFPVQGSGTLQNNNQVKPK
jgi:hypothetical protein